MTLKIPPAIAKIAPDGNMTPRQIRHFMLERIKQRVKPGSGSAIEFLHRRTALNKWPDLREILKGIPWMMVGGVATRAYMPERQTKDMDILVRARDGERVIERLTDAGYKVRSRLAVPGFLLRAPSNKELDVIFGSYRWLNDAMANPNLDPAGYPTIPLAYLIVMKLNAARNQDWVDVSRMIALASEQEREKVRRIVAKYSPEDLEDFESLLFIGAKELEMPSDQEMPKPPHKPKNNV